MGTTQGQGKTQTKDKRREHKPETTKNTNQGHETNTAQGQSEQSTHQGQDKGAQTRASHQRKPRNNEKSINQRQPKHRPRTSENSTNQRQPKTQTKGRGKGKCKGKCKG